MLVVKEVFLDPGVFCKLFLVPVLFFFVCLDCCVPSHQEILTIFFFRDAPQCAGSWQVYISYFFLVPVSGISSIYTNVRRFKDFVYYIICSNIIHIVQGTYQFSISKAHTAVTKD